MAPGTQLLYLLPAIAAAVRVAPIHVHLIATGSTAGWLREGCDAGDLSPHKKKGSESQGGVGWRMGKKNTGLVAIGLPSRLPGPETVMVRSDMSTTPSQRVRREAFWTKNNVRVPDGRRYHHRPPITDHHWWKTCMPWKRWVPGLPRPAILSLGQAYTTRESPV